LSDSDHYLDFKPNEIQDALISTAIKMLTNKVADLLLVC
jgi:hypothetical protein